MQELLTKGIDENGNIRSEETHRFKDSPLGRIPEEWEVVELGSILKLLTDYEANGSFELLRNNVKIYDTENYAWFVRATDLENNLPLDQVKYIDHKSYKFLRKTKLNGGEILVTKRGEIGKIYRMPFCRIKASLGPNLYLLIFREGINLEFIYYFLKSDKGQKALIDNDASTTLGALYKDDVKKIKIFLPPPPEQKRIASILSQIDEAIEKEQKYKEKLERIKRGLMEDLLTGKVRVNYLIKGAENV